MRRLLLATPSWGSRGDGLLPAGYFGFTGTLNIPDNVSQGEARGTSARATAASSDRSSLGRAARPGAMQVLATSADVRDVTLKNFVLCGDFGSGSGTANTVTGLLVSGVGEGAATP